MITCFRYRYAGSTMLTIAVYFQPSRSLHSLGTEKEIVSWQRSTWQASMPIRSRTLILRVCSLGVIVEFDCGKTQRIIWTIRQEVQEAQGTVIYIYNYAEELEYQVL
jgi:hypothetical protein